MSIPQTSTANLTELSLRLPLLASMRVHQSAHEPTLTNATQSVDLWLADLAQPVKLSRWATGFRNPELGAFSADVMAAQCDAVLTACAAPEDARVLVLAHPDLESDIPRAYWVVDAAGSCIGQALDLQPHLSGSPIVAMGDDRTVTTTVRTGGQDVAVAGHLRSYLDTDHVRLGLQLFSTEGERPIMTVSMTGRLSAGNARTLFNAATALAA